ncbi:MAG: flagellar basal body-associated FliL family protein [SAR324 cluster bacterium]|nr:flagellar basal body-associated FliL family protein [SAR324 cluster bacterium]
MADEEGGGGGGKKKLIIIIVAVVLLLVIAIVAVLLLTGGEEEEEEIVEVTEEGEPLAAPIFLPLDSYIVNLKDGRRYLKTTIQLMLSEEMASAYLTARIVEIKDIVLSELQDLSVEDIKQAESREALRQRLISAISQIFPSKPEWVDPEPIKKVLFEEFVLQ